jgi:hypothetical protein
MADNETKTIIEAFLEEFHKLTEELSEDDFPAPVFNA